MKQTFNIPEGCKVVTVEQIGNQLITSFEPEKYVPKVGDCVKMQYKCLNFPIFCLIEEITEDRFFAKNVWISSKIDKNDIEFGDSDFKYYHSIEKITPEEFRAEFEKLGYVYDFETHTASKKRWRAERGCEYFFFSNILEVHTDTDIYAPLDNKRYNIGNYFQTEKDAEAKINEIKKLLKQ